MNEKLQEPIDYMTLWGDDPPKPEENRNFFDEHQAITSKDEEPDSDE